MPRHPTLALVLAATLAAGGAFAGTPAKAPAAPPPVTIKSIVAKWNGQQVRIVKDGDKVEVKNLLAIGEDHIKVEAAEGETYIPLSRIRSLNVQGDKLFINVN